MNSQKILEKALQARSTATAASMWRLIADGEASEQEAFLWVTYVAKQVVIGVFDPTFKFANRRADAALKAIGFHGPRQKHEEVVELLDALRDVDDLKNPGRKLSRNEEAKVVLAMGHFKGQSVSKVAKVIDRIKERNNLR